MNSFYTKADIPKYPFKINYNSKMLWLGSCFTTSIGGYLSDLRFKSCVNPFGVIYNPLSIYNGLKILVGRHLHTKNDLFFSNELWHSFNFHGSFSSINAENTLNQMNNSISNAADMLYCCDYLLITFGSAFVYKLKNGLVAANCHKLPAKYFDCEMLTIDSIVNEHEVFINSLNAINPSCRIIFSVSPIRHLKYGTNGNNLSKSVLHLAVNKIVKQNPEKCFYFPAYEIVNDELRDYRFYADDMCHPSNMAVNHIREVFKNHLIDAENHQIMKDIEAINTAKAHRPLYPYTDAYKNFAAKIELKQKALQEKFPQYFSDLI